LTAGGSGAGRAGPDVPIAIESHLSRIFSKLDVSSRTEVARQVERARENVPG
jgi:hypothetical protein